MLYGKYRFICQLENDAVLPLYKGSTFRGVFGHALKRVVCALKRQKCDECLLKHRCIYALVFETPLAMAMPEGSRISSPPHPFVIEPPLTEETQFVKGSTFHCHLILVGDINHNLPYFVYAFDQMGKIGIGKRINGKRGKFTLKEVRSGGKLFYSDTDQKLNTYNAVEVLSVAALEDYSTSKHTIVTKGKKRESPDRVPEKFVNRHFKAQVRLETPLRLKFENEIKAELPFHILVRAMLRRMSSLFNVYGNGEPALDYKGLVNRAEDIQVVDNALTWFDWRRYSNRQDRHMFMGGMVGSVVYEGKLGEYLPLLDFCEKVHLGKNTSFGLGQIAVMVDQA